MEVPFPVQRYKRTCGKSENETAYAKRRMPFRFMEGFRLIRERKIQVFRGNPIF